MDLLLLHGVQMSAFSGDLAFFRGLWTKHEEQPISKWALEKTVGYDAKANLTMIMDHTTGWATLEIDDLGAIAKAEFARSGELMREEKLQ